MRLLLYSTYGQTKLLIFLGQFTFSRYLAICDISKITANHVIQQLYVFQNLENKVLNFNKSIRLYQKRFPCPLKLKKKIGVINFNDEMLQTMILSAKINYKNCTDKK